MKAVILISLVLAVYLVTNAFTCKKENECTSFKIELNYDDVSNVIGTQTTHGTAPFKYVWSNGASTSVIIGPNSGTYSVTVTDLHKCSTSSFIKVP